MKTSFCDTLTFFLDLQKGAEAGGGGGGPSKGAADAEIARIANEGAAALEDPAAAGAVADVPVVNAARAMERGV
jgi:hypothetical protein